jgi:hypothetical protein
MTKLKDLVVLCVLIMECWDGNVIVYVQLIVNLHKHAKPLNLKYTDDLSCAPFRSFDSLWKKQTTLSLR